MLIEVRLPCTTDTGQSPESCEDNLFKNFSAATRLCYLIEGYLDISVHGVRLLLLFCVPEGEGMPSVLMVSRSCRLSKLVVSLQSDSSLVTWRSFQTSL